MPGASCSQVWRVLRRAVAITPAMLLKLQQSAKEANAAIQADKKRLQGALDREKHSAVLGELELALSRAGELTRKGRLCGDAVVLSSLLGCEQQPFHFDFPPEDVRKLRRMPCSAILAVENGSRLIMRVGGKEQLVVLEPGDVLVFDGDVEHAGAAYPHASNIRVHVYLDVPQYTRVPNSTHTTGSLVRAYNIFPLREGPP